MEKEQKKEVLDSQLFSDVKQNQKSKAHLFSLVINPYIFETKTTGPIFAFSVDRNSVLDGNISAVCL